MKSDKEFIEGIYKKYNEEQKERKNKKIYHIQKIVNLAAVMIVICSLVIISNTKKEPQIITENGEIREAQISLETVGNFEKFYNVIKANSKDTLETNDLMKNSRMQDSITEKQESSKTNIQIENVDEADIVKISDNYIYYIVENKIVIINAEKAENAEKVSEINYQEETFLPRELYAKNNKLIVIGSYCSTITETCKTGEKATYDRIGLGNNKLCLIIYNIENKLEPKEIRRVEVDGNYVSSRMIGNNIYFATKSLIYSSGILRKNIEEIDESEYKPKYKDTNISQEEKCIDYNRIYCFEKMEETSYLIIAGLDIESDQGVNIQTFLGAGDNLYSSEKNMYICKLEVQYDTSYRITNSTTHILKFELNNGTIKFKAEADVSGQINNQFSMDENEKYFRIATTIGSTGETGSELNNNLYILDENLKKVGEISGFATGERIYSVRYVGNKAYVVTFKQIDPLFVIDLSEPTNPQILGQLKIPGYSIYLHPYDETHIIGFGYDTKSNGKRVTTNGLKMSMFDISDVTNPKELFGVKIAGNNANSELEYNHKALLYSKEKNIIGFPLSTYQKGKTESKAVIYNIDIENGFSKKGEIINIENNWKQRIERIVYVNNTYYALSKELVKLADMDTLKEIKEINI